MSTRSIVHIHDNFSDEPVVCSFYRHSDGYPEEAGNNLAKWLVNKKLVNGIGADFVPGRDYNGAGVLAIPLMMHIQVLSGARVIPTLSEDIGEEFVYDIYFRNNEFIIKTSYLYSNTSCLYTAEQYNGDKISKEIVLD